MQFDEENSNNFEKYFTKQQFVNLKFVINLVTDVVKIRSALAQKASYQVMASQER